MKTTLFAVLIGMALGWVLTADYYQTKQLRMEVAKYEAEQERNKAIGQISTEYYNLYQDSLNREPVVRTERVFVKSKCTVQTNTSAGVDNGASAGRVELAPETVRSLDRVIGWAEKEYEKCAVQLSAAQAVLLQCSKN